jgi:hypothetical protein
MNIEKTARRTMLLVWILMAGTSATAARVEEPAYPVRWRRDPGMNLFWLAGAKAKSLGDFDLFLDKTFPDPSLFRLPVFDQRGPVTKDNLEIGEMVELSSCREAIKYRDLDWHTSGWQDGAWFERLYVGCRTVQLVARLRPSKQAFLPFQARPFAQAVGKLLISESYSSVRALFVELKASKLVGCANALSCRTRANINYTTIITIDVEAVGDFDGDGVQDLIVNTNHAVDVPHDGRGDDRIGFVVSRKAEGGDLIVLDAWW